MSIEHDEENTEARINQARSGIIGFLKNAEVNSPKMTAFIDATDLQDTQLERRLFLEALAQTGPSPSIYAHRPDPIVAKMKESDLRIAEMKLALVQLRIRQHESREANFYELYPPAEKLVTEYVEACIQKNGESLQNRQKAIHQVQDMQRNRFRMKNLNIR